MAGFSIPKKPKKSEAAPQHEQQTQHAPPPRAAPAAAEPLAPPLRDDRASPPVRRDDARPGHARDDDDRPPPQRRDRYNNRHERGGRDDRYERGGRERVPIHVDRYYDDRRRRRSRSRSRSRTPPRRERKRRTGFDVGPAPDAAGGEQAGVASYPPPPTTGFSAAPVPPIAALIARETSTTSAAQVTKHARRVFVGGVPVGTTEDSLKDFFDDALRRVGGMSSESEADGTSVIDKFVNSARGFGFVEFRTATEASNAMAFDGALFEGVSIRMRRPNDYDAAAAASLGPAAPEPTLQLNAIPFSDAVRPMDAAENAATMAAAASQPGRIFVGGLPYYASEMHLMALLSPFGAVQDTSLARDPATGRSLGHGTAVFEDPARADYAVQGLHGMPIGTRTLELRRSGPANETMPAVGVLQTLINAGTVGYVAQAALAIKEADPGIASTVVLLENAVTEEDVEPQSAIYDGIVEEMEEECSRFGYVLRVVIPRPAAKGGVKDGDVVDNDDDDDDEPPAKVSGVGRVFVHFADQGSACAAQRDLNFRHFGTSLVRARFYPETEFQAGNYGADADPSPISVTL